jgi:hypothetical protein
VTRSVRFRAGMIGVLVAVLLLPGCGKKGPLDPPPGSGLQPGAAADPGAPPARGMPQDFDEEGKPIAPPGPKKAHQFLDWLLN